MIEDDLIPVKPFNPNSRHYRCCCNCCHVKDGSLNVCMLTFLCSLLSLVATALGLWMFREELIVEGELTYKTVLVSLVVSSVWVVVCFLLFIGLKQKRQRLLIPYFICQVAQIVASICGLLYVIVFLITEKSTRMGVGWGKFFRQNPYYKALCHLMEVIHKPHNSTCPQLILINSISSKIGHNYYDLEYVRNSTAGLSVSLEEGEVAEWTLWSFALSLSLLLLLLVCVGLWFLRVVVQCYQYLSRLRREIKKVKAETEPMVAKEEVPTPSSPRYNGVFRSNSVIHVPIISTHIYMDDKDPFYPPPSPQQQPNLHNYFAT